MRRQESPLIDIVRFDHISMAVVDLDAQVDLLERLFGFRTVERFENDEGYLGATLDVPGRARIAWEVLAPNGPGSYLHRFLAGASGPGLHHVTIEVRDAARAADALRYEGIDPWGERAGGITGDEPAPANVEGDADDEGDRYAGEDGDEEGASSDEGGGVLYIHPRRGGRGVLFQLYAGDGPAPRERFWDDGEHTLGIMALNHIAHAHADLDALGDWYERLFGCYTTYRSPRDEGERGFVTRVLQPPGRQLRIEAIAPSTPASFIQRYLDRRGPGLHHVTFEVEDWERALAACEYHEVPIFGELSGETDGVPWREAFIHPRHTGGMLVQFFWEAAPGAWF